MGAIPMPPPPRRVNVTREVVEARMGSGPPYPFHFVGTQRPAHPKMGDCLFVEETGEEFIYCPESETWQLLAGAGYDYDWRREREWHCAYCRTVFVEQRCPTCGAGRGEE
jgi:hypothetical protein